LPFFRRKGPRAETEEAATVTVEKTDDGVEVHIGRRSFSIVGHQPGGEPREDADYALFAAVALGLAHNLRITMDAPVTGTGLRQAIELGEIWKTWCPSDVYPLKLEAINVIEADSQQRKGGLVCASGGVDSTYSMLNARRDFGFTHALLIDGTDYPDVDQTTFDALKGKVAGIAGLTGLELVTVRTDLKKFFHWRMWLNVVAINLSMCLRYSGAGMGFGGFSADMQDYGTYMIHPWGNNPVVAKLLGTPDFPVRFLGNDVSRTQKLKAIMTENPEAADHMSFCFRKDYRPRNCGTCEKCVRTRLCLLAVGSEPPNLFAEPCDLLEYMRNYRLSREPRKVSGEIRRLYEFYRSIPDGAIRDEVARKLARAARPLGGL
jgi:hypothetical protein